MLKRVLPNLFSTTAHLPGTTHQTAHWISGTHFVYKMHINYVHLMALTKLCNIWLNFSTGISTMLGNSGIVIRDREQGGRDGPTC